MAMTDVTVVLAHGGWADGSSWGRVITGLAAHGVKSVAAPLPLTDLADDVAALNRTLARVPGPVVLAAHAYAGAVIGLAPAEHLKALVYVNAFAPDDGETLTELFFAPSPIHRRRSWRLTATTCSGCPTTPSPRRSRRMRPLRTTPCSPPRNGRCGSLA
jgi:pimeloyl-ACP methyl ester carboxylesterase